MQAEPSPSPRETSAAHTPPHCVFVTGPRGAGKTRWLQRQIHDLAEKQPGTGSAVLLAGEGRTRMERFAQDTPGLGRAAVRHAVHLLSGPGRPAGSATRTDGGSVPSLAVSKCQQWPLRVWWRSLTAFSTGRVNWSSAWTGFGRRASGSTPCRPSRWYCWNSRTASFRIRRGAGFLVTLRRGRFVLISPPPSF